jgi:hypothetical protein
MHTHAHVCGHDSIISLTFHRNKSPLFCKKKLTKYRSKRQLALFYKTRGKYMFEIHIYDIIQLLCQFTMSPSLTPCYKQFLEGPAPLAGTSSSLWV